MEAPYKLFEFTITGEDETGLSDAVAMEGYIPTQILMPSAWTAAALTFQNNESELVDTTGAAVQVTADAGQSIILPMSQWVGVSFLRIRSGTSGTPVAQAADRLIRIIGIQAQEVSLVAYTLSPLETLPVEVTGPGSSDDDPMYVEAGANGLTVFPPPAVFGFAVCNKETVMGVVLPLEVAVAAASPGGASDSPMYVEAGDNDVTVQIKSGPGSADDDPMYVEAGDNGMRVVCAAPGGVDESLPVRNGLDVMANPVPLTVTPDAAADFPVHIESGAGSAPETPLYVTDTAEVWLPKSTVGTVVPGAAKVKWDVPTGKKWRLKTLTADLETTADVGNRRLQVFEAAEGIVIASAGAVQAASLSGYYTFGVGLPDLTAFRGTANPALQTPLPEGFIVPAGTTALWVMDGEAIEADDTLVATLYYDEADA